MKICVFIGDDSRMREVAQVCALSLKRHSSIDLDICLLDIAELRATGLIWRREDPLASTEFTYSRFLTPHLAKNKGAEIAVFCDNDFLWLADIADLVRGLRPEKAVHCVWHDYQSTDTIKMDGKIQTAYPRKYWSSLMVFSVYDPRLNMLTPTYVNQASGAELHRFQWLDDSAIGALEAGWNWLEGASAPPKDLPKAIHFTRGGPWFDNWQHVDFGDLWLAERDALRNVGRSSATQRKDGSPRQRPSS